MVSSLSRFLASLESYPKQTTSAYCLYTDFSSVCLVAGNLKRWFLVWSFICYRESKGSRNGLSDYTHPNGWDPARCKLMGWVADSEEVVYWYPVGEKMTINRHWRSRIFKSLFLTLLLTVLGDIARDGVHGRIFTNLLA